MSYEIHQGDCLELMSAIPDGSVDMVMADLPYAVTACKWDTIIPFDTLWVHYKRVCKPNAAIVLTASQPFTSVLVCSNLPAFKYEWVWRKSRITGVLNAKRMPVRCHEQILVFCFNGQNTYNPQGLVSHGKVTKQGRSSENYGERKGDGYFQEFTNYPRDVLDIPSEGKGVHPTQKPVALMEYLIRTYTNPGELVLDNTCGSGTTGVACMNTGRRFYGIEKDADFFQIAQERIREACLAHLFD